MLCLIAFLFFCPAFIAGKATVTAEYNLHSPLKLTENGYVGELFIGKSSGDIYGKDIGKLAVEIITSESNDYVRVKITDPNSKRWEIPPSVVPRMASINNHGSESLYDIHYTKNPFTFEIVRKSDGVRLVKSSASLVFKDQYIKFSLESSMIGTRYGLGESTRLTHALQNNETYTMWASDDYTASVAGSHHGNLYSSFPYYMEVQNKTGTAHGVMLFNSNGMDVTLDGSGDKVTFEVIGGIIDLYVFNGPSPLDVVAQLTDVIGRPTLMPYWALGFHNCKWGYKNIEEIEEVVANYSAANIPLDVQWFDIDYMRKKEDFTTDPIHFPTDKVRSFADSLHDNGQKLGVILDPGLKAKAGYLPYDEGLALDLFVKDLQGNPYIGQVWPGPSVFPDFFHPKAQNWWTSQIEEFHQKVPIDGIWIDMNEISNFCNEDGRSQVCANPKRLECPAPGEDVFVCCLQCETIDPLNNFDFPPFNISNDFGLLSAKTMAMSAVHYGNIPVYDAHNLYGMTELIATTNALSSIRNSRPFVLTRSSFLGSGQYGAKWTGDNGATWDDLKSSIISILDFNLEGIPMIGAEICGFNYNTTEELCARWIEVGAFYTFARDHNRIDMIPQELYRWESVAEAGRLALGIRYRLLPYIYSLFYGAHTKGHAVIRPLWMNFPSDTNAHSIQTQFMLGGAVMIAPVLDPNVTYVKAYFPNDSLWYDFSEAMLSVDTSNGGGFYDLFTPLTKANVFVAGGSIVPLQDIALTTKAARKTPFTLFIALSSTGLAKGQLYWDDGEQVVLQNWLEINYAATVKDSTGIVDATVHSNGRTDEFAEIRLNSIIVLGKNGQLSKPVEAFVGNKNLEINEQVEFNPGKFSITFKALDIPLSEKFVLKWI